MNDNRVLELRDDLLLGKGCHKACWIDPRDEQRCVKVAYSLPDMDIRREMKYRRVRRWRNKKSDLLPHFYGMVDTNRGKGFVYERIVDYDGHSSLELGEWLNKERERRGRGMKPVNVERILATFRDRWIADGIIMYNTQVENIMVQQLSANWGEVRLRIVDNIGTHSALPIFFFWDYMARKSVRRYWNRLLHDDLHRLFPDLIDDEMMIRLKV